MGEHQIPPVAPSGPETVEEFEARVVPLLNGTGTLAVADKVKPPLTAKPPLFKNAKAFCAEYVPLSYVIEPIVRSASLYTLTATTGAGKTAFNVVSALAIATGRSDILGRAVVSGRAAYLACENPDDIRMRLMIAAYLLNLRMGDIGDRLVILDRREKPEDVHAELSKARKG